MVIGTYRGSFRFQVLIVSRVQAHVQTRNPPAKNRRMLSPVRSKEGRDVMPHSSTSMPLNFILQLQFGIVEDENLELESKNFISIRMVRSYMRDSRSEWFQ